MARQKGDGVSSVGLLVKVLLRGYPVCIATASDLICGCAASLCWRCAVVSASPYAAVAE